MYSPPGGVNYTPSGSGSGQTGGQSYSYAFSSNPYAPYFSYVQSLYWAPADASMSLAGSGNAFSFSAANLTSETPTKAVWEYNSIPYDPNGGTNASSSVEGRLTLTLSGTTSTFLYSSFPSGFTPNIGVELPVIGNYSVNFIFEVSTNSGSTWTPQDVFYNSNHGSGGGNSFKNFDGQYWNEQNPVISANTLAAGKSGDGNPDTFNVSRSGTDVIAKVDGATVYQFLLSSINTLTINGSSDVDTLTVDYTGGNPTPTNGLSFAGGGQTQDALIVQDTSSGAGRNLRDFSHWRHALQRRRNQLHHHSRPASQRRDPRRRLQRRGLGEYDLRTERRRERHDLAGRHAQLQRPEPVGHRQFRAAERIHRFPGREAGHLQQLRDNQHPEHRQRACRAVADQPHQHHHHPGKHRLRYAHVFLDHRPGRH